MSDIRERLRRVGYASVYHGGWENGNLAFLVEAADIIDTLVEAVDDLLWFTVAGYPEPPHDISDTVMRAREALKAVKGEQQRDTGEFLSR